MGAVSRPAESKPGPLSVQIAQESELAAEALKQADVQRLYALWEKASEDRRTLFESMGVIVAMYGEKQPHDTPAMREALAAMERVAREAIDLGKKLVDALIVGPATNGGRSKRG